MNGDYAACLKFTLLSEGGFVNDPHDPGGATMKGITLATYRSWKHNPSLTATDLKQITDAEVSAIYKQNYWDANSCDSFKPGVDLMVFDMDVNAGNGRSAKLLQATVGAGVDGAIGPKTIALVNSFDPVKVINGLADHQLVFYKSLSTWQYFGKGWTNRIHARTAAALEMAAHTPVTPVLTPLPVVALQAAPLDEPPVTFWSWLTAIV
jgi:lysozyme family protein